MRPDRYPYRRHVAGCFLLSHDKTSCDSASSIESGDHCGSKDSFPLSCDVVGLIGYDSSLRDVSMNLAFEKMCAYPIRDVCACGQANANVTNRRLLGEAQHGKPNYQTNTIEQDDRPSQLVPASENKDS